MDDLPEGWANATIAELFEVNPPKPPHDRLAGNARVSFVPMDAIDAASGAITGASDRLFGEVRKGYTAFAEGDVILAKITPCFENGKAAIARKLTNGLGFGSSEYHVLRSRGAVTPEFVFQFLRQESFRASAADSMTGTAGQGRVPVTFLRNVQLPVPPLVEQNRIVTKVEELLAQVTSLRARLSRSQAILKRFRRAVLAAACSGKLTAEWRRVAGNVAAAHEHSQSADTASAMTNRTRDAWPEVPDSWKWHTVEDLLRNRRELSYGILKPGGFVSSGVPMVRVMDVRDGWIDVGQVVHVSPSVAAAYARTRLEPNDVVLAVMATIGRAAVIPPELAGGNVNRALAVLRLGPRVVPEYMSTVLRSPVFQSAFSDEKLGSAQSRINMADLRQFSLPVPPLPEQHEILRRVNALFLLASTIEARAAASKLRVDKLPQAIMRKALVGELVPNESDLARREGRDFESATALLQRIAVERAQNGSAPTNETALSQKKKATRDPAGIRKRGSRMKR
jgi:type I restriction enzyme S subunit